MIGVWQGQIVELGNYIKRLEKLKIDLSNNVIPNITKISNSLFDAVAIVKNAYTVDNVTADANSINDTSENIENLKNSILNSVIPSINSKISNINSKINNLNYLITNEYKKIATAKAAANGGKSA